MIKSLKGYSLLEGIRGKPRANIESIQSIMMQVSELIVEFPEIFELDLNPIIVNEHKAIVVDARMVVTDCESLSRHIHQ
jgi:acetyltransferase